MRQVSQGIILKTLAIYTEVKSSKGKVVVVVVVVVAELLLYLISKSTHAIIGRNRITCRAFVNFLINEYAMLY